MWKFLISAFFILLITIIISGTIVWLLDKEVDVFKSQIGRNVIIDKDTLTIVDYNLLHGSFTLSNGIIINRKLVIND